MAPLSLRGTMGHHDEQSGAVVSVVLREDMWPLNYIHLIYIVAF